MQRSPSPLRTPASQGVTLVSVWALSGLASCAPEISCENLCERTLACEVTFAPSDDIDGKKVTAGSRSDQESCVLGCEENPAVTADSARCVDSVTDVDSDPVTCQRPVAACFDVLLDG